MTLSQTRRKLLARLLTRKTREREGLFLVEGIRSAREALVSGAGISFALLSPRAGALAGGDELIRLLEATDVEISHVGDEELEPLSATESPQGVILVCKEAARRLDDLTTRSCAQKHVRPPGARVLLLDGIQDPGNAGTLVRVAAAFGLDGVIALDGTVDLYNPKVVRASAGGIFRIPVLHESWQITAPWLGEHDFHVVVGDALGEDVAARRVQPPWALALGSEGAGVRPELASAARQRVSVPMPGGSESLNAAVAGSILLYVMTRETTRLG